MALTIAQAIGIGLALGVLTGIPLGVVNVAVVEQAGRDRRRATWLGIGGAVADASHTVVAIIGYGAVITRSLVATRVLAVTSAIIIAGYVLWGRARTPTPRDAPATAWRAFGTGLALTLPNPGALLAWTAVAGALFPTASVGEAVAAAAGVGLGSALWFATLARIAARTRLGAGTWASRAVSVVLLALAAIAVARTLVSEP